MAEDTEADTTLLGAADWCLRYTPLVAGDAPDGLLLDISGCAHLYGGEQALVADLAARLKRRRLRLSHGNRRHHRRGACRRPSWRAGSYHLRRGARIAFAAAAGRVAVEPGTVAALARVGLKRVGDIVDLARAPLDRALRRRCCASSTARWDKSRSR